MVNVQYYCFLTNIITKTKICESETTFFNFVNLPKREKIPLIHVSYKITYINTHITHITATVCILSRSCRHANKQNR